MRSVALEAFAIRAVVHPEAKLAVKLEVNIGGTNVAVPDPSSDQDYFVITRDSPEGTWIDGHEIQRDPPPRLVRQFVVLNPGSG